MEEISKAHKARIAIRSFKTLADAMALRGFYKPSGSSGQTLSDALKMLSPEIYGSMNDPRIIELKGLEYVIDRLPRGVEKCTRIILTAQEDLEETSFEKIYPLKRRRTSYRVSDTDMCFVITRGLSEIYDLLTHLTFLNIEATKIRDQMCDPRGHLTTEWRILEETIKKEKQLNGSDLDRAIWNLSMILGRTYHETLDTFKYLEINRKQSQSNQGLFQIIYCLGNRVKSEDECEDNKLTIYFTPSLKELIGHHKYGGNWARIVKGKLLELGFKNRPLHIISANIHSVLNTLYGYAALKKKSDGRDEDIFDLFLYFRDKDEEIKNFALHHGLHEIPDCSGSHIDCQIIDTEQLEAVPFHPEVHFDLSVYRHKKPVILVMDYAFGAQAFEVMDELLSPFIEKNSEILFDIKSISVMGKAGILPGKKGDIILANSHVLEGTAHNYPVKNDLKKADFQKYANVYVGPIVTVLGTSLQNRDVLEKFQMTTWKAVGLEMEGGHYQQAISAAIIRGHIPKNIRIRYAYYASDNPLLSGQTLAYGGMGQEGIRPTYLITKIILEKILGSGGEQANASGLRYEKAQAEAISMTRDVEN